MKYLAILQFIFWLDAIVLSIHDIQHHSIPVRFFLGISLSCFFLRIIFAQDSIIAICTETAMLLFLCMIIFRIAKDSIGSGDILVIILTALALDMKTAIFATATGIVLAAIFGISLVLLKKATRKTPIPWVPFFFAAAGLYSAGQQFNAFLPSCLH